MAQILRSQRPGEESIGLPQLRQEAKGNIVPVRNILPAINTSGLRRHADGFEEGTVPRFGDGRLANQGIFNSTIGLFIEDIYEEEILYPSLRDRRRAKGIESTLEWLAPLKGQVIVDIGAGNNCGGYQFARIVEARAYIGVEGHFPGGITMSIQNVGRAGKITEVEQKFARPLIPAAILGEDMLSALRRIPSDSVSVLASAVDCFVIDNRGYLEDVASEVNRVLSKDGLFINRNSAIYAGRKLDERVTTTKYAKAPIDPEQ